MTFFTHSAVGVTITDTAIEIAQLAKKGKQIFVKNAARTDLASGIVQHGRIVDMEGLTKAFTQALAQAQPEAITPRTVVCALPPSRAYTRIIHTPKSDRKAYEQAIARDIRASVPLAPEQVRFSYTVIPASKKTKKHETVTLLALVTSNEVLHEWHDFFSSLNIRVSFAAGAVAAYRTLSLPPTTALVGVIDVTDPIVTISFFDHGVLQYRYGRSFAADASALEAVTTEIHSALTHVQDMSGKPVNFLVLIAPKGDAGSVTTHLEKELSVQTITARAWIKTSASVRLATSGLALYDLGLEQVRSDPRLTKRDARTLPAQEDVHSQALQEDDAQDLESAITASQRAHQLRRQKITFGTVALIGILGLSGAYFWRVQEKARQTDEREAQTTSFTQTQSLAFAVPIETDAEVRTDSDISGRIVTITIQSSGSYDEAVANARREAEKKLEEGEVLWERSVNEPADTETVTFPLDVAWLIYSKTQADDLLSAEVEKQNSNNTPYTLNLLTLDTIEKTDTSSRYTLKATVQLSLNELLPSGASSTPTTTPPSSPAAPATTTTATATTSPQTAVILDTPTGWLNVRSGPGTGHARIDRVLPGSRYSLLETREGWHRIMLGDSTEGWVFGEFVSVE